MKSLLFVLTTLLALSLAACNLGGTRHAQTSYVLTDARSASTSALTIHPQRPGTLLVAEMDTPVFYRNPALAFSRETGTRSHYQYARHTDPPGVALTTLISRRLAQSGLFQAVSAPGQGIHGQWQLNLRLIDFFHDAGKPPGQMRLAFEAELVALDSGRLLARKLIEAQTPVDSLDAAGAASAANLAVGQGLDLLALWLHEAR